MSDTIKMTILDHLVSFEVTAETLTVRAEYWTKVAERHVRAGREDQANRLFAAAKQMKSEAKAMTKAEKESAKKLDERRNRQIEKRNAAKAEAETTA